jgi:hypothetical protein
VVVEDQRFDGKPIFLDGFAYCRCTFVRCTLIFSGLVQPYLDGCQYEDCVFEVIGPAKTTVEFLQGLSDMGNGDVVAALLASAQPGRAGAATKLN